MSYLGIMLYNPLLPIWVMAACFAVFAVCAWLTFSKCPLAFWQRTFLFSLRIAAFLVLCWLLLQPVSRTVDSVSEKPSLAVVVDTSASMEDALPGVSRNRAAIAKELLASEEMKRLTRKFNVLSYGMGDGLARLGDEELSFTAGQSRLVACLQELRQTTRNEHPVAAILLTDGLDTSGLGLEGLVLDIPLIVPELENAGDIREDTTSDFSVTLADSGAPRRVVRGWKTGVRVNVNRLRGKGACTVPVALSRNGQELEVHEVEFSDDARYAQTVFELTPEVEGVFGYRVEIRPAQDSEAGNNRGEFVLEVVDEANRVLYLEGLVRQDFKFMKRSLLKEKSFQSSIYVRMGSGVFVNFEDSEDPRNELKTLLTEENLKKYKVLILGEFPGNALEAEQVKAVMKFVEKGGGLLLSGASRAYGAEGYLGKEQFGPLSPVTSQVESRMEEGKAFPLAFTAAGRNDSSFMKLAADAAFSPLQSVWRPVKVAEGASVFLETSDGSPVLAVRRYGEGRVCILLSNTLYTLRLHGGAADGISFYDQLISQVMFWMLPDMKKTSEGDSIQLLLKNDAADLNQKILVGALTGRAEKADGLKCEVSTPDGKTMVYPMQSTTLSGQVGLASARSGFLSEFKASIVGTYQLEIVRQDGQKSGKKLLVVRRPVLEMTGEPINRVLLKKLAESSGGRFLPFGQFDDLLGGIKVHDRKREIISEETQWNSWWWLLPLMALFCLEWAFRRHWNLV